MNRLRQTIRKIILENQHSEEMKIIDLIASWEMPNVRQALELGEMVGYFEVEEEPKGWAYKFSLKNCSEGFLAALQAHPRSEPMDSSFGISWDGRGTLEPLWHTAGELHLSVDADGQ